MQRIDSRESPWKAFLSLPVFLAIVAMIAFYSTIVRPDRGYLTAISPEKPGQNSAEVLKEARNLKPWKLMEKRDLVGAVRLLQPLIHANPNDVAVAYCAAMVLQKSNNSNDAFKEMRRALGLAPRNKELRLEYARMLVDTGKIDEAIAQYRIVLKQSPKLIGSRMDLAFLYLNTDRPAEAAQELADLLEIAPNNAAAHKIRGIALARAGRAQEGMDEYMAGIVSEHGAGLPEGVKLILGQWGSTLDKAKYNLEQESLHNPDDALAKLRLAEISLYADRPAEARDYLIEARKHAPENPEIHRSLCVAFKRLGDNRQALTSFMQSVALEREQSKKNPKQALLGQW